MYKALAILPRKESARVDSMYNVGRYGKDKLCVSSVRATLLKEPLFVKPKKT